MEQKGDPEGRLPVGGYDNLGAELSHDRSNVIAARLHLGNESGLVSLQNGLV